MSAKPQTHICDCVMDEIHDKHITMKPRFYFIAGSALLGAGMVGAVVSSVFFTHLTLYRLRHDATFQYLDFGTSGFVHVFPWVPFLIAAGGLIGGSYLLREYEIAYKHRYTRLLIAFVVLLLVLGYVLDRVGANKHIVRLRPLHTLYQEREDRPFVYGKVEKIEGNMASVRTPYNTVVAMDLQSAPKNTKVATGSSVRAIGVWRGEVFFIQRILVR